jgi:hypothetical protein
MLEAVAMVAVVARVVAVVLGAAVMSMVAIGGARARMMLVTGALVVVAVAARVVAVVLGAFFVVVPVVAMAAVFVEAVMALR